MEKKSRVGKIAAAHGIWKSQKSLILQHCERSELRLHFEWTKFLARFRKSEACSQTVLRIAESKDRSR